MRPIRRIFLFLVPFACVGSGCTTLPDVKPYADTTAALAAAAGTHYHDVANDIAALKTTQLSRETDEEFVERRKALEENQQIFAATGRNLDALFDAMTAYSEKVASLAAAGKTGADAAQSLLDSAKGFGELAGFSGVPVGAATNAIANGFKAIADEFTKMEARKSLEAAVAAAQPGVDLVSKQFEAIYGTALPLANDSIRNTRMAEAELVAGPAVIGFSENVEKNYNSYYRFLISLIKNDASPPASTWRGFCRDTTGPCRAVAELEAVGLVEARMVAIQPIVDAYRTDVGAIEATYERRRLASQAVIKAVKAWAREHDKLRRSLEDGTSLSAFNLKAALIELEGILGHRI
jgi:hypothetical protein